MYQFVVTLLVSLCIPNMLFAWEIIHIRQDNNLSTNSISAFVQDSSGFMWIGTDNGLERFDGYNSYKYSFLYNDKVFPSSDKIEALHKSKDGNIWISSTAGVFLYKVNTGQSEQILDSRVFSYLEDNRMGMWIASSDGLFLVDSEGSIKRKFTRKDGLSSNQITCLAKDKNGGIWISTENGIDHLILNEKNEKNEKNAIKISSVITGIHVPYLLIDSFDYLWYSSREYLYVANQKKLLEKIAQPAAVLHNVDISTLYSTGNEVWIGTKGNGIIRCMINPDNHQLSKDVYWIDKDNENDLKNSITVLYEDNYSNVWVGTKDGMYMILRKKFSPFVQLKKSTTRTQNLIHNTISGLICDDKNKIWLATAKGLNCFSWTNKLNEEYEIKLYQDKSNQNNIVSNNKIQSLIQIDDNTLMLSTKNDVKFFDMKKADFYMDKALSDTLLSHQLRFVRCFYKDRRGNVYMAFASGNLAFYDIQTKRTVPILLKNNDSWGIAEDNTGTIWVASGKDGVFELTNKDKFPDTEFNVKSYNQDVFGNGYAVSILCDHHNLIWIGTSEGLYLRNQDGSIIQYMLPYQENNNYIEAVLEDPYNNIWAFGINGVYKIGANRDEHTIEYYEFDEDIARAFYVFGRCVNQQGWIFSGGINGLMYFDPSIINKESYNNIPVISSFKIMNKEASTLTDRNLGNINITKKIKLKYDDYQFSFNVSSLYYPDPYKIRYAYKLNGYNKSWIYLPENDKTIMFTNVPPGNYSLQIKATDTSGLWSGLSKEIEIEVTPPWWNTWWSWIIYISALGFIIFLIIRYISANYHFRHQEEVNQWKIRFFVNLSYGFINPLNMLQVPIRNTIDNFEHLPGDEIKNTLTVAYRNIKRLQHLVNQLVEFRKIDLNKSRLNLSCIDIAAFLQDIYETFEDVAFSKNINFVFDTDLHSETITCDPEKIEVVIFNLLSNAFKYTEQGGEVILKCNLDKKKKAVRISVSDTGRGISQKDLPHIFERFRISSDEDSLKGQGIGLSIAKDFIEMHSSEIRVTSHEGKGSCFDFLLLSGDSHFKTDNIKDKEQIEAVYSKENAEFEKSGSLLYRHEEDDRKLPVIYFFDTDKELTEFIKYSLRKSFYIKVFIDKKSLLSALNSKLPVLIISDIISLDKQEGIALCKDIKSTNETAHIPVMLTYSVSDDIAHTELAAYEAGADVYISKPYDISYLRTRINQLLESKQKLKERVRQELIVNPKEVKITSSDDVFLASIMNKIEENMSNEAFSIDDLAESLNVSRSMLYRRINNISGLSPLDFIKNIRLKRAAQLLETASFTVSEVCYRVGFSDTRYFSTCFKKQYGISPKAYSLKKAQKT